MAMKDVEKLEERRIAAERLAKHRRIANEANAAKGLDGSDVPSGM